MSTIQRIMPASLSRADVAMPTEVYLRIAASRNSFRVQCTRDKIADCNLGSQGVT